ncbi:MAG: tetratricopeptide repeat protein [Ignavibacteria bacterium]
MLKTLYSLFILIILLFFSSWSFSQVSYDSEEADKLLNEEKFQEAAELYKQLINENIYNGYLWSNYGYCLYKTGNYQMAIEMFNKAINIGYESSSNAYNIACCYSLLKDPLNAVKWIHITAKYKFNNIEKTVKEDKDFDNIRNDKIFQEEVLPSPEMLKDRILGWKTDLKFMKRRMEETHFNINRVISKQDWDIKFSKLEENIEALDDAQIFTELMKITASVGDGHTSIYSGQDGKFMLHYLPLQFFMFEDGLYVIQVSAEYKELAGKKIKKIGNTNTNDLLEKIKPVASLDNELALKWTGMFILTENDILYGLGITEKNNETEITTEDGNKVTVRSATEKENPIHSPPGRINWIKGWKTDPAPLYLKNRGEMYWYEYIPVNQMVYMQLNGIGNKPDEKLNEFALRVFRFIDTSEVKYFVLDIRFNGGGNNTLNKALVQEIIKSEKINKVGSFFTIIGRNTFSAAQCLANSLENETNVIFAGEPTGSKPNFVGESSMILLPYSGSQVNCSSRYWQSYFSDDLRQWIAPQLAVKYYYNDYYMGNDPAMNAVLKYISRK